MSKVFGLFGVIAFSAAFFAVAQLGAEQPDATSSPFVEEEFLPVDEAFELHVMVIGEQVKAHWDIQPGYYLYQERMGLDSVSDALSLREAEFDREGEMQDDPTFGPQRVYFDEVEMISQIMDSPDGEFEVQVSFQGCAESGLCYPPTSRTVTLAPSP